jgi:hypothetical protein
MERSPEKEPQAKGWAAHPIADLAGGIANFSD